MEKNSLKIKIKLLNQFIIKNKIIKSRRWDTLSIELWSQDYSMLQIKPWSSDCSVGSCWSVFALFGFCFVAFSVSILVMCPLLLRNKYLSVQHGLHSVNKWIRGEKWVSCGLEWNERMDEKLKILFHQAGTVQQWKSLERSWG